jgi:hypothetical protein
MDSLARRATRKTDLALPALFALLFAGCVSKPVGDPVGVSRAELPGGGQPVAFGYDSLDARPLTSEATRGRPTVLAFVTTYDLSSQAQVNYLVAMAKRDGARADAPVNYGLVALQESADRELVEVYRTNLGVTFPVAMADPGTIAGGGPFGDVHHIPTVVILDRRGRVVWRRSGLAKSDEIRAGLRGL